MESGTALVPGHSGLLAHHSPGNFHPVEVGNKAVIVIHMENRFQDFLFVCDDKLLPQENREHRGNYGAVVIIAIPDGSPSLLP
jgi:hypothetical protein